MNDKRVFGRRRVGGKGKASHDGGGLNKDFTAKMTPEAIMRRHSLKRLISDAKDGIERIALITELAVERLQRLADGLDPIDQPMAMHLKEMLRLTPRWLEDSQDKDIPEATLELIKAESWNGHPDAGHAEEPEEAPTLVGQKDVPEGVVQTPAYLRAQEKLILCEQAFPAIRKFLNETTGVSLPTISGVMTEKRRLTPANTGKFERALKMPKGWLNQPSDVSTIQRELIAELGEAVVMAPRPRRGRARKADSAGVADVQKPQVEERKAPARKVVKESAKVTPVEAKTTQPSAPKVKPQEQKVVETPKSETKKDTIDSSDEGIASAILAKIQGMKDRGELSKSQIAKLASIAFE